MMTIFAMTALACLVSLSLTPMVRHFARQIDLVDRPDGRRKLHGRITPLGGGVAVLGGATFAILALLIVPNPWQSLLRENGQFLLSLAATAAVICMVGLIDDRVGLRGRQKLIGQIAATGILVASGLVIRNVTVFGWHIELGLLAVPFTMFWLLGAINSLNLIDGLDALATSVGCILSLTLALMAFMTGHDLDAILALAMMGSLLGFLWHNFPPATIFLGDAGSMLIGLVLGTLAIRGTLKGPATIALAAPTALWAIPIFDVSMAILRRKLTGRSIYTTDRGHLHHCLLRRGYSGLKTVTWIGFLCACTSAGALISVYRKDELLAVASVLAVLSTLVLTRFFGHAECMLLVRRVRSLMISLFLISGERDPRSRQLCTRLQGTREWEELWQTLTDFAERFDLSEVQLNVNLPALHEEYHASWARKEPHDRSELWDTELPLVAGEMKVGRLKIVGTNREGSASEWMSELISGLKPFEHQLAALLEIPEQPVRVPALAALPPLAADNGSLVLRNT